MELNCSERVYANHGNQAVVDFVDRSSRVVLDVGCGAGDNAALLKQQEPARTIFGITASSAEAERARRWMAECWVADLEGPLPSQVHERQYDTVICSHVLEHLRDPAVVVERLAGLLRPGGSMVIAVPNVMFWFYRRRFAVGRFEYESHGTMDATHLRFFSYHTADRYLLQRARTLRVTEKQTRGSVPLGFLRGKLPRSVASWIDLVGGRYRPNLFGFEVLLKATKADGG